MNKAKTITIKDVAKAAGVSTATVSRILGGATNFSTETRKHVWDTIHELHYEPNSQARILRGGKNVIGKRIRTNLIMYVSYVGKLKEPIGCPVTAESMQMFSWIAQCKGIFSTFYRYNEKEGFCCPPLLDHLIDGAIVGVPHKDVISTLSKKIPVVAMNVNNAYRDPNVFMVNPAIESGFSSLLDQVKSLGHSHAAIAGSQDSDQIYSGNYGKFLLRMLSEHGFSVQKEHIFQPLVLPEDHDRKMEEIAERLVPEIKSGRVTLIAAMDMCYATTIYNFLQRKGIRLPEDVSLISLNSVRGLGTPLEEEVTSVGSDWPPMMTTAIELLEKLITGERPACSEYLINTVFNPGKTLGKASGGGK